jgi:ribosomal protein S18 acetylase RimI-like enzyme
MPALRLYDKFGVVTWGRRRGYYRETGEDALLLTGAVKDILNVAYTESGG